MEVFDRARQAHGTDEDILFIFNDQLQTDNASYPATAAADSKAAGDIRWHVLLIGDIFAVLDGDIQYHVCWHQSETFSVAFDGAVSVSGHYVTTRSSIAVTTFIVGGHTVIISSGHAAFWNSLLLC